MKNRIFIWLILIPLATLITACAEQPPAEESCNFVQNKFGRRVSWARMPIRFYADDSITDEQYFGVQRAMNVWNKHFDRPVFELIGMTTQLPEVHFNGEGRVVPDGYNGIYLSPREVFENSSSRDEQARTSISYRGDFIYEADILIDASERFYFENEKDLQSSRVRVHFESLMIHELGHVLGLEHIDHEEGSVMDPKLAFGEYRVELGEADFESLACEYQ